MTGSSELAAAALSIIMEEPRPDDQQIAHRLTSMLPAGSKPITVDQAHDLYQQGWADRDPLLRTE